ncbi:hypothetical protein Poli38472_002630 [Pythium oligandrum]|uniref:CDAN1-interacting nuclease 1 n=1 Tax=Pythium oligandrum TaxID=41045 RepID=A0A8K1FK04_PYTOL|nr:hypothetical protein Poli38472_002630 [Pythium oligandrum]|eukprot:TMW63689.1 hypothetical protein Poli38472_002630 [Pythium oligandrum]
MDEAEYERVCALDAYPVAADGGPGLSVSEETFAVIKRQVEHRRLRGALRQHRQDKTLKRYIARHGSMEEDDKRALHQDNKKKTSKRESFCAIAQSVNFSPCMLARVLLEAKYGWTKTMISNLFKDVMSGNRRWPLRMPAQPSQDANGERKIMLEAEYDRLWKEIGECIYADPYCSPLADRIRHNVGLEYEYILTAKLQSRGMVFESEDVLREKGLSKTPDVRLVLPIGVRDKEGELHVVHWIDSKAMFGDRHTHETENASQLQGYVNRYGPGMVIYWFGHVANLSSDRDVFITDAFPTDFLLPGDLDPFEGTPSLSQGDDLQLQHHTVATSFDDDFHPMSTCVL